MEKKKNIVVTKPQKQEKSFLQSKWFYVFVFIFSALLLVLPIHFRNELLHLSSLGLLGLFLINFLGSATIFLPAPVIISVGIAGAIYNPLLVALVAALGSSLGESTGFLFGFSSKEIMRIKNHKLFYFLMNFFFKRYGFLIILLFSIIPNPVIDGIGIFAGMSGYSWKKFIVWVFIGRLLRNILIANVSRLV